MTPSRITAIDLATLWKVSPERVYQLCKDGKLSRDGKGMIDLPKALEYRAAALDTNQVEMLFQTYKTKTGIHPPKIFEHLTPEISDEDILGPATPAPTVQEAMKVSLTTQSELTAIRVADAKMKLERQQRTYLREDGKLIERAEVYRTSRDAAAEIAAAIRALEHEIPHLFPDHAMRKEVRGKVQAIVDRTLFALHKKFDAIARPLDDDIDDDLIS